jgi:glycine/D-amino acid oxidase-like deaminating enzyme
MSGPGDVSRVRDCIVVGGGIAGCTVAYELARRGLAVTLYERRSLAHAASGRNMGLLLNQVEAEAVALMWKALEVYREVEAVHDFQLRRVDQLLLAGDESQLEHTAQRARSLRGAGMEAEMVEAGELRREMPSLSPGLAGGAVVRGAWALEPAAATRAFAEAARSAGAEIRAGVTVARAARDGVLSDAGRQPADLVVVATGPWLADLLPNAPVSAGRGWVLRLGRLPSRAPWIIEEMSWPDPSRLAVAARPPTLAEVAAGRYDEPAAYGCVIAQRPGGDALVGTSLAPSLRDAVEGVDMPRRIAARAASVLPGLREVPVTAAWYGMRPMAPDGMPVCGEGAEGVWMHGGHGSIGMMSAPATARWLVDAIVGTASAPDLRRLSPERFGQPA